MYFFSSKTFPCLSLSLSLSVLFSYYYIILLADQYHNDFLSAPYGKQYNDLADVAVDDGRIQITGCPDRV